MSHDPKHAAPTAAHHGGPHAGEHAHPDGWTYVKVGAILTIITIIEVWAYYIPALVASPFFNPSLLIMSAVKFAIVVMFYMHLKYDHKLFRVLFTGPLIIAMGTIVALLFLFHQLSVKF
ncbi:MAG: cytochrome C oxidase subunit IV family protein [Gemmatimonadales bacterium]|nr:cytochrome C oxidase subunit IV family protein [Gemmatimonadales bacterium]